MSIDLGFETKHPLFSGITKRKLDSAITEMQEQKYFVGLAKYPQGYLLRLCPDGNLYIMYEKGNLFGTANTTAAGPGFHKACINFIDKLGVILNQSFIIHDCTDYAIHRDFSKLKQEMLLWLDKTLAIADSSDIQEYYICWSLSEYRPKGNGDIITQRGLLPRSLASLHSDAKQLELIGDLFWVWSNESKDAQYYRGCALSIMWQDIIWRNPVTEKDTRYIRNALTCLKKAAEFDSDIPLPITEWNELRLLLGEEPVEVANPVLEYSTLIGYRRNIVSYPFPSNFYVKAPGTFRVEYDSDRTQALVDQDKSVRLSVLMVESRNKEYDLRKNITYREYDLLDERKIEFLKEGFRFVAQYGQKKDEENESCILLGQIMGKDSCAIVTMCWNGLSEAGWAIDCFKSIHVDHIRDSETRIEPYK